MIKYLTYCHASEPPIGIKIGQWYSLDELKERFGLDYVTQFFFPSNFSWTEVEEIYPKKKNSNREVKQNKK